MLKQFTKKRNKLHTRVFFIKYGVNCTTDINQEFPRKAVKLNSSKFDKLLVPGYASNASNPRFPST